MNISWNMCQQKQKMFLQNNPKWQKVFLSRNGCGLSQSNHHHPRNTLSKYCCDRLYRSWVEKTSKNWPHGGVIGTMLSLSTLDTCSSDMTSFVLLDFEMLTCRHYSFRPSIVNCNIYQNIKSLKYDRKKKSSNTYVLNELNILIVEWFQ